MKPMKLTDVALELVEKYITDPNYIMQQKHDGARMLVVYKDGQFLFTNDGVKPITFSAAVLRLPALEDHLRADLTSLGVTGLVLDGELIVDTGVYHAFDVLQLALNGTEHLDGQETLRTRLLLIEGTLRTLQGSKVRWAVTAKSEAQKRALWTSVNEQNVEGAISKHLDSLYVPGTRTKEWVKHKLVKTADVVVTAVERKFDHKGMVTHGSAELAVAIQQHEDPEPFVNARGKRAPGVRGFFPYEESGPKGFEFDPRTLFPVGNASLIGKELTIEVGSVVEVAYLNFQSAMIQPRILRQRFDKPADECDLAQFPEYTRNVVELEGAEAADSASRPIDSLPKVVQPRSVVLEAPSVTYDGPRTGRGPSGNLRNFHAMGDAKFEKEAAKIEAENNDPDALEAVRASRALRAVTS